MESRARLKCHFTRKILILFVLCGAFPRFGFAFNSSDVGDDCKSLLENFATTAGIFTFCAISNARPIRLCEICILQYVDVLHCHEQILKLGDSGGKACQLELINLDRLEIIESTFKNVVDLWSRGRCDNCLEHPDPSTTPKLNNVTVAFRALGDEGAACFERNNGSECSHCAAEYRRLNEAYEEIKLSAGENDVCIDLVDTMNSTRNKWSQEFGCTAGRRQADLSFLLTALGVAVATVLFYFGTFFATKRTQRGVEPVLTDEPPRDEAGTSEITT